jgi:hypothetical protein
MMTRLLIVWGAAPALVAAHVVRCVWAEHRARRRELRDHRTDARAHLRLVEPCNVVSLTEHRNRRMDGAA